MKEGYKQTEIGEIPEEWEVARLIDYVDFKRGCEPGSHTYNQLNNGVRFIRVVDLSGSREDTIYTTASDDLEYCTTDDILIVFDGSPGIVKRGLSGVYSSGIRKIILKCKDLDLDFIYFILQTDYVRKKIVEFSHGVTIKHASKAIPQIKTPLPPLPEQKKIASMLSIVDAAIEKTNEIIEQAKQLKKGLMQELLTRGIGHTRFKQTEIGEIPEEWEVARLIDYVDFKRGCEPGSHTYNNDGKGIPFLQGKAEFGPFYPRHIKFTTSPLKIAESGSILISVRAPVGDVNIANINYCIGRGLASISVRKGSNIFLFYLLKYFKQNIEKEGTGSTFKAINKNKLENFKIPFPSLEEQKKIAEILGVADAKIEAEVQKREQLQMLKKGLMQDLLTGRVRFPEFVKGVNL